ncbi:hypothetical protein BASA81_011889 [Batrachochytrium salamandrivorans]|nr:hypothetical protein BASA81_011889 [Batrachochytrium salamandrivorans]
MYLIATISANPHPAGGSGSVSESTETTQGSSKWFRGFDTDNPKGPQDTQTREHDNEDTTTSNAGPEYDPSGFTDIFLGPDEDNNTEVGSTEESEDSTAGQIQAEDHEEDSPEPEGATQSSSIWSEIKRKVGIPGGYFYRPKETVQSPSKLPESEQETKKLLELPNPNTNPQSPIQLLTSEEKTPIAFKDPEDEDKVVVWDILSLQ